MASCPPRSARTIVLVCCLLVGLSLGGCLGSSDAGGANGTPTDASPADRNVTSTDEPVNLNDTDLEERVLATEEDYITERLESAPCVNSWGLTSYGGIDENATISERTDDGTYVEVSHPYWYGTDSEEVDAGTHARYLVSNDAVQRVDGDDLSPC